MAVFSLSGSAEELRPSLLPALLAVVSAIVFWMLAEDARERLTAIDAQIQVANRTASRVDVGDEADRLRGSMERAKQERAAIEARLQTTEDAQLIRARIVFDLRQQCAATGASACNVRLADDTITATASSSTTAAGADAPSKDKAGLVALGVQKARAIISGSFQKDEVAELGTRLNADPNAYWRINGLVVRGSTFEFDVERHIMTSARGGS